MPMTIAGLAERTQRQFFKDRCPLSVNRQPSRSSAAATAMHPGPDIQLRRRKRRFGPTTASCTAIKNRLGPRRQRSRVVPKSLSSGCGSSAAFGEEREGADVEKSEYGEVVAVKPQTYLEWIATLTHIETILGQPKNARGGVK